MIETDYNVRRDAMEKYYLAVDIGASSGRHILGTVKDGKMELEEIYRFANGMSMVNGELCWDCLLYTSRCV